MWESEAKEPVCPHFMGLWLLEQVPALPFLRLARQCCLLASPAFPGTRLALQGWGGQAVWLLVLSLPPHCSLIQSPVGQALGVLPCGRDAPLPPSFGGLWGPSVSAQGHSLSQVVGLPSPACPWHQEHLLAGARAPHLQPGRGGCRGGGGWRWNALEPSWQEAQMWWLVVEGRPEMRYPGRSPGDVTPRALPKSCHHEYRSLPLNLRSVRSSPFQSI